MKKLTVILIAALVAISACTKVERDPATTGRKIFFTVGNYAVGTKTGESSLALITRRFQSRAFLHAYGVNGTQDFFGAGSGEMVSWDGTDTWAPGTLSGFDYFWPFDSRSYINFVCWYDRNGAPDTLSLSETNLEWTDRTITPSDTILFADAAWRYNSNEYHTFDIDAQVGVPVLFHHALGQIAFKGKLKDNSTTGLSDNFILSRSGLIRWEVYVKDVVLSNVCSTGSLTLSNIDPGTANTTQPWTASTGNVWDPDAESAGTLVITDSTDLAVTAVDLLVDASVMPQAITNDMALTMTYGVRTYLKEGNSFPNTPHSVEIVHFSRPLRDLVPTITSWPMGTRTIYTIEIDPASGSIIFAPTLEDWDPTVGGGTVTLE